jgi:hypothetical protein
MKNDLASEGGGFTRGFNFPILKKNGIKTQPSALKLFLLGIKSVGRH